MATADLEGYDLDRFVNRDLAETLQCNICLGVLRQPRQCWRQHLFCKACLGAALEGKDEPACPVCRCELGIGKDAAPAQRIVEQILHELLVRCVFFERGCDEVVKLGDLAGHERACPFGKRPKVRSPFLPTEVPPDKGTEAAYRGKRKKDSTKVTSLSMLQNGKIKADREEELGTVLSHCSKKQPPMTGLPEEKRRRRNRHRRKDQGHLDMQKYLQFTLRLENVLEANQAVDPRTDHFDGSTLPTAPEFHAFRDWEASLPVYLFLVWLVSSQWFPHYMNHPFRRQAFAGFMVVCEFWSLCDHGRVFSLASSRNGYGLKFPLVRRLVQKSVVNFFFTAALLLPPYPLLVYAGALAVAGFHAWSVVSPDAPSSVGTDLRRMLTTWDYWQLAGTVVSVWYNLGLSPPIFNTVMLVAFLLNMFERMPVVRQDEGNRNPATENRASNRKL